MRFPFWSYLLWAGNVALQSAVLFQLIRRRSLQRLWALHAMIGLTLATDALCVALLILHRPMAYGWFYWTAQNAEIILRGFLAVQILAHVLRRHIARVIAVGLYAAAWATWAIVSHFRPDTLEMLRVSSAGNFLALGLATAAIVIPSGNWPRGWTAVSFGIFAASASELTIALMQKNAELAHLQVFQIAWQLAPIAGLLLFYCAARDGEQEAPKAREMADGAAG